MTRGRTDATWLERLQNQAAPYRRRAPRTRPSVRFVIYGQGRTGSSLLRSLLNTHPDVHCDGEILGQPVLVPESHVERHARLAGRRVFGFKVKIYQLTWIQDRDPASFLRSLQGRGYRIIHLYRENLLRHAISNLYAEHRGHYHDRAVGERPSIEVDPDRVTEAMRRRQQHRDDEDRSLAGLEHLRLTYEDDLLVPSRQEDAAVRVFRHLGLEPVEVSTSLARSVTGHLADRITNYDELVRSLADTPYERFLEDVRYGEAPT